MLASLLSKLFTRRTPYENRLLLEYTDAFCALGFGQKDAKHEATQLLSDAKKKAHQLKDTIANLPNLGDDLLRREPQNPEIQEEFDLIRSDGVRDEDIRWWWNQPLLERGLIELADEIIRTAAFIAFLKQGFEPDDAATKVKKAHAIWAIKLTDLTGSGDEDRPIRYELKRRIQVFLESTPPNVLQADFDRSTSFNALVREKIREGKL